MANDREILREIWEGKLPICFRLDPEEVYELQQPDPFYLMVPRLSYFPLVIDKVAIPIFTYKNLKLNISRTGKKTFHEICSK